MAGTAVVSKAAWPGSAAGTVEAREQFAVVFDVQIEAREVTGAERDRAEYIITVNGRVVKRMTAFQAERLGVLAPAGETR